MRIADSIAEIQRVLNRSVPRCTAAHAEIYDILMFSGASEHSMGLFSFDLERYEGSKRYQMEDNGELTTRPDWGVQACQYCLPIGNHI